MAYDDRDRFVRMAEDYDRSGAADGMLTYFARWTERNVRNFGRAKTKGDDLHDPVADQLGWLREAGLEAVDLYVKDHLWCLIGGRCPQGPPLVHVPGGRYPEGVAHQSPGLPGPSARGG